MKLHKEGNQILIVTTLLTILLTAGFYYLLADINIWIFAVLELALLIFVTLIFRFFRVPKRVMPSEDGIIYCPADGKVVVIEETEEGEYFKDKRIQVSVFMSPLNVHVNYYPCEGSVTYTKYHPGKFLVAWHPKSSTENERSTVAFKTKSGVPVLMRQIAGAVARRIITYSKPGDNFKAGDQFGFIKFGSRVDMFLPLDAEILVNIDQVVTGSQTPLARIS